MPFPLPLTPFEYYYWCDDQPEYPTTYPVTMTFSGAVDRGGLEGALAESLRRHPMLTARIEDSDKGVPMWVRGDKETPDIDWAAEGVPVSHPAGERIDLRTGGGLRVWVRQQESSCRVMMQFHHACCDGIGALRFAEDLLVCYSRRTGGASRAVLRPVMPELLRQRGAVLPPSPGLMSLLRDWGMGAFHWASLLGRSPQPVASPGGTSPGYQSYETATLDAHQAGRLRAAAIAQGVTVNDLMLRDLFQTLRAWNAQRDHQPDGWLRINMPASLRSRNDQRMPAANLMGFTFLTRTTAQCAHDRHLLESIRRETEAIKQWQLGFLFLGGLMAARTVPGAIPWMLRRQRSFATAVLSNVGRIFPRTGLPRRNRRLVCGNLVLEQLTGTAPIRPLTRAAICVVSYANQTTLNLRCDPHCFGVEQTRQLLEDYVARLEFSAATRQ